AKRLGAQRDPAQGPLIDEALDRAAGQVERASQILRRLRTFIRKGAPELAPEDIAKLIEEGSAIALVGARERGVTVHLQTASHLPAVLVDKIQIQQVIVNLMRNAVEAMEPGPRRELTLEAVLAADARHVVVRVIDTGPGLAPDVAERLFQPFVT